ncbi:uncharacterized protein [Epargyreus clarus]|uniref:uncharacterized protein n=1 Tax=Epargyreus clarus TaxID=520877 RepID=UPI003C2DA35D
MSAVEKSGWSSIPNETLDPKYEKCRNITEEIYKRINITFQIKKLEMGAQSDVSDLSDQIDSNELSNETDLFACDKSSLTSTDAEQLERGSAACEKYININNNEEQKKPAVVCRRPRKRFRKRIKKAQKHQRESDGSSDEGPPLSLVAELGRPRLLLLADITKLKTPESKPKKTEPTKQNKMKVGEDMLPIIPIVPIDFSQKTRAAPTQDSDKEVGARCSECSLPFRTERGLRRHMTLTHQTETANERKRTEQRGKTA